jgi:hypothetical protein
VIQVLFYRKLKKSFKLIEKDALICGVVHDGNMITSMSLGKSSLSPFFPYIPAIRRLSYWPDLSLILKKSEETFGEGTLDSRRVALYLSHRLSGLSLGDIGKYFGEIGPSGVTQNTKRFEERLKEDSKLFQKVENLKKLLSE